MGESTAISWTDHTFNPWWGCTRVSPGCQHCYAETFSHRLGKDLWGKTAPRQIASDRYWTQPHRWNRDAEQAGRPALVFCASMADVFEDRRDLDEPRERLWQLIAGTPHLIWQLLTKRPENIRGLVPASWLEIREVRAWRDDIVVRRWLNWPPNAWVGTTVEDQQRAEERIPKLLQVPAPVRFLSCEPLLGPVELTKRCDCTTKPATYSNLGPDLDGSPDECPDCDLGVLWSCSQLDWIIVGGESGPGHRPLNLDHARSARDQAVAAGVPFLFKQVGGRTPTAGGDELDGRRWHQFPPEARR